MNAVIVTRAQIDGGKAAVIKLARQCGIAPHQRGGAVLMALGLKDLLAFNLAKLADGAIDRAHPVRLSQRTSTILERPRKKGIECLIGRWIGVSRLGHIDLVTLDKATNDCRRQASGLGLGQFSHQDGQSLLGQEILRKYGKSIRHSGFLLSKL